MCELLGMSANVPTDITFSMAGFLRRGGATGPHRDGWGVAFYEQEGYREFKDPHPSIESPVARLMLDYPIKSRIVISHIRQANVGEINLSNTHPFSRELWGRNWCYAHNGQLAGFRELPLSYYLPVGSTDSEWAFCWLLGEIRRQFPEPPAEPEHLLNLIHQSCEKLRGLGVFNLLFSDSQYLYAYCSTKLAHITRRAPFGPALLKDTELEVDFSACTTPRDIVSVLATEPLTTNETWQIMQPGDLVVYKDGEVIAERSSHSPASSRFETPSAAE